MIDYAVFLAGGTRVPLLSGRATDASYRLGPHGMEALTLRCPATVSQAMTLYHAIGTARIEAWAGGGMVGVGRIEDVTIEDGAVSLTALGGWRLLGDRPYTAFWSATGTAGWIPTKPIYLAAYSPNRRPEMYRIQIDERMVMALTKSAAYTNNGDACGLGYRVPHLSSRGIVGAQYRLQLLVPNGWQYRLYSFAGDSWSSGMSAPVALASAGTLITRAYHVTFGSALALETAIWNESGATSTPAGETGSWYCIIEEMRLVTSTTNRVNTTLTAARAAGTSVTATVGSTARMYAGMRLVVNSSAANSELIIVENVTNTTQFVATFAQSHSAGEAVQGFYVQPDEIVRDVLTTASATPTAVLNQTNTALITACQRDVTDCVYEDVARGDVLSDLADAGDGSRRYVTGVNPRGYLSFRRPDLAEDNVSAPATWSIDVANVKIQQTIDTLVNNVYARYKALDGRVLRTANQSRLLATPPGSLTRIGSVQIDTTVAQAAIARATLAVRETDQTPTTYSMDVLRLYTISGVPAPLWLVEPGHTVTIRNLPFAASGDRPAAITFTVANVEYDAVNRRLTLEPESPIPTPEYIQAAIQRAAEAAATNSQTPSGATATLVRPEQARQAAPTASQPERSVT